MTPFATVRSRRPLRSSRLGRERTSPISSAFWLIGGIFVVMLAAFLGLIGYTIWVEAAHPLANNRPATVIGHYADPGKRCGFMDGTDCTDSDPSWSITVKQDGYAHFRYVSQTVYLGCIDRTVFINGACPAPGTR